MLTDPPFSNGIGSPGVQGRAEKTVRSLEEIQMIQPIILSGGSGARLWRLSREALPKQLLPLLFAQTMLHETALRLIGFPAIHPPLVVCNQEHRFLVDEQMRNVGIN